MSADSESGHDSEADEPRAEAWTDVLGVDDEKPEEGGPKIFQHPEWTVGLVLVFAVVSLLLALANPIFLIIGSPFILVLGLWIGVRIYERRKARAGEGESSDGS